MNDHFEEIAIAAYNDEMEKLSGVKTELIGSATGGIGSAIGALAAAVTPTKTDDQMKKQQKKTWSNLIPGVGTYRYFKRLGHSQKRLNEMNKKDKK